MLILIGLGLNDEKDISLKGIEEAKKSDQLFIENYTGLWNGSIEKLQEIVGKEIKKFKRNDLEENSKKILELAKRNNVAIFFQGDPLFATTHISLISEARKQKIKTKVIHNSSVYSAVAESGLHLQKFGATVSIPLPARTKGKLPESIYETIKMNKLRGLHTLCLLDIDSENSKFLYPHEAANILLKIEEKIKEKVFDKKTEIVVFSRIGSDEQKLIFETIEEIASMNNLEIPAVLIILGMLHFTERDYLQQYRNL